MTLTALTILALIAAALAAGFSGQAMVNTTHLHDRDEPRALNTGTFAPYTMFMGDRLTYKFTLCNLNPDDSDSLLDMDDTRALAEAINIFHRERYYFDTGAQGYIVKVQGGQDCLTDPNFWDGTAIPLLIGTPPALGGGGIGFHSVQWIESGFAFGNSDIQTSTGIAPTPNFPQGTPYSCVSSAIATSSWQAKVNVGDPYTATSPRNLFTAAITHEIFEAVGNPLIWNTNLWDNTVPFMSNVYFAPVDGSGNVIQTPLGENGFIQMPLLNSLYPGGYLMTTFREHGDPVSWSPFEGLNAFQYRGFSFSNYPTNAFFDCFQTRSTQWDYLGYVQAPCQPFGGLHELIFFTDLSTGTEWVGQMINMGPLDGTIMGPLFGYNFPANATVFMFYASDSTLAKTSQESGGSKRLTSLPTPTSTSLPKGLKQRRISVKY